LKQGRNYYGRAVIASLSWVREKTLQFSIADKPRPMRCQSQTRSRWRSQRPSRTTNVVIDRQSAQQSAVPEARFARCNPWRKLTASPAGLDVAAIGVTFLLEWQSGEHMLESGKNPLYHRERKNVRGPRPKHTLAADPFTFTSSSPFTSFVGVRGNRPDQIPESLAASSFTLCPMIWRCFSSSAS
jgi:hypothetical protein